MLIDLTPPEAAIILATLGFARQEMEERDPEVATVIGRLEAKVDHALHCVIEPRSEDH